VSTSNIGKDEMRLPVVLIGLERGFKLVSAASKFWRLK